jgi:2-polyprenyl-6-methoxyphenol hydroxylase-like FAD-dependent oxidoreductase
LSALKKDVAALRARLVATCGPVLGPIVAAKLNEQTESQLFKIIVDRVKPWHAPGILFLGDAAHTMSPSGGQGLNVALRDTFAAANALIPALKSGEINAAVFEKIEAERLPEIDAVQAGQTRAGQMVMRPLPALHMMFTMLPVMMKLMPGKFGGSGAALPQPSFLPPV